MSEEVNCTVACATALSSFHVYMARELFLLMNSQKGERRSERVEGKRRESERIMRNAEAIYAIIGAHI